MGPPPGAAPFPQSPRRDRSPRKGPPKAGAARTRPAAAAPAAAPAPAAADAASSSGLTRSYRRPRFRVAALIRRPGAEPATRSPPTTVPFSPRSAPSSPGSSPRRRLPPLKRPAARAPRPVELPPVAVRVEEVLSTAVHLRWAAAGADVLRYSVLVSSDEGRTFGVHCETEALSARVEGLHPNCPYQLTVVARYDPPAPQPKVRIVHVITRHPPVPSPRESSLPPLHAREGPPAARSPPQRHDQQQQQQAAAPRSRRRRLINPYGAAVWPV
eukprot:TRINITY_DN8381_c3_g1_i1.p1 TRINITY_DN8381_c3_g1~~TRINITY_DN8381_c3_g1_i1.p1  ORF type:complete len:271 (+),score=30.42 TRINITY_DN8381_c3_g1_i1:116-928(+)